MSLSLKYVGKCVESSILRIGPAQKVYQKLDPRLNLKQSLRHFKYHPITFEGVKNVRKFAK